jgi:RND family efflux transporter MFP subunit
MYNRILAAFALLVVAVACNSNQASDKSARLAELRKQQAEISEEIKKLERELQESGEITVASKAVLVTPIEKGEFKSYIEVQGRVDARENVDVNAKSMGIIKNIYVKVGQQVSKDQVLAELDNEPYKKSIAELKSQLAFAKTLFEKRENLWKQKIGSELEYLSAKNQKESLELSLASLNEQLEMTRIKAPIAGMIDEVGIKIGQAVQPGIPTFKVVNYNDLRVVAELAESHISKVKQGDKVKLLFKDLNKEVDAEISFVAKTINQINRTFRVEVALQAGSRDYYPNMITQLRINDYTNPDAIVIPVNIIQRSENGDFVFVAIQKGKQKVAEKRNITTGKAYGDQIEVVSGLSAGDQVITTGYSDLNEGQFINY